MLIQMKEENGKLEINDTLVHGKEIEIRGSELIVDGKQLKIDTDKEISIHIHGNVENLGVLHGCVEVHNATTVICRSGDVICGDVVGSVTNTFGNIECGEVEGSVSTIVGDVNHGKIVPGLF
ncbi:hypothetical protein J8M21_20820 [Pseudoalteromonas luteoviolacea]|uniref:hypothetical protein n=1 Tax=Pseudoalteromonas luteoviolacea TaxID=43657 RepID=UPI001B3A71C9|nr:hypothetical protein [Pseudoalteromonas luteoviolacea]MBQ4879665.1 hypothetical protein [Pseudoalteromonas luteoviolacea]MBQ4908661.1 hypothetical protein [Pseudoalteromonas luteoviolacea]